MRTYTSIIVVLYFITNYYFFKIECLQRAVLIHKIVVKVGRAPELELKGPWFEFPCDQLFFLEKNKKYMCIKEQREKKEEKGGR